MSVKTFKDLEFKDHPMVKSAKEAIANGADMEEYAKARQAIVKFDNGKELSVVFGSVFYSNGVDTYEAMEYDGCEPRGYLTKEEVTAYMLEIQEG